MAAVAASRGGKYLVNGLECRLQDSQVIPNQACRFRNFFLGPILELFSASFSLHFQEIPQIMSTPLTRRNLLHFQEFQQIMSTRTQTWHSWLRREKFRNGAQKKVPESAGLVRDDDFRPLTKYFPPMEAATAADLAQAFEPVLRRLRQQPT